MEGVRRWMVDYMEGVRSFYSWGYVECVGHWFDWLYGRRKDIVWLGLLEGVSEV